MLSGILITHHHADHNSGVNDLIKFQPTKIYSPDKNINKTSNIIKEGDLIKFDFIEFLGNLVCSLQRRNALFRFITKTGKFR